MLKPNHDHVIIEVQNKTESGIFLSSNENNSGTVVAIGPEVKDPIYKVGSKVYYIKEKSVTCGSYIVVKDEYIVAEEEV